MIVADASIVVSALLSNGGAGALARERFRQDPDLHVPHLLDVEVAAALRRRVRLGQTDVGVATEVMADSLTSLTSLSSSPATSGSPVPRDFAAASKYSQSEGSTRGQPFFSSSASITMMSLGPRT